MPTAKKPVKSSKPAVVFSVQNVSKRYRLGDADVWALRDFNLDIRRGESVVILGPSGSGKSTLLHLLGALDHPTSGRMLLDGIDVTRLSDVELARVRGLKIGFVFQFFFLVPTLTTVQNVELPMVFAGVPAAERRERAEALLRNMGLGDRLNHKPNELSGGQRQRVAVARALANNPSVILADEPTGNLDSKTGKEIMQLFTDLNRKEGRTIVTVTHDASLVSHATRSIHLRDGKIEKQEEIRK